ncbi:alpha/beta hydrolase [Stieleria sp. JC731]|uniref:alpha/beta hydrolase n=1 Tax=Pirellulaceae TaxID=2691357 RepID=UPI001E2C094F|nr:alpha/beta hydrolase [Stieleria sp. JC731]MCC9601914.1 alpha/beta hydrolase [Stieleria sp. JC731]
MYTAFELYFKYHDGTLEFRLLSQGLTYASHSNEWNRVEPTLQHAIDLTEKLETETASQSGVLAAWTELIVQVIGQPACHAIHRATPAEITIHLDRTIPESHRYLFEIAPWDIVLPTIADTATDGKQESRLTEERTIIVNDVMIDQSDREAPRMIAGSDPVAEPDFYLEMPTGKQADSLTGTLFPVWFGTNRQLFEKDGHVFEIEGSTNIDNVHYGQCDVWIPTSHRRGELKSPWYKESRLFSDSALRIENTRLLQDFAAEIKRRLQNENASTNHLLFIHGFNNSFADAILRAGQLGFDLGIDGATIAFSWPSRNLFPFISRYNGDGEVISGSRKALEQVCERLQKLEGTLHVIAHSMGNRGLLQAWKKAFEKIASCKNLDIGQIVFAAPDVFQQTFKDETEGIEQFCKRATLYASKKDRALGFSRLLSHTPRAGLLPPPMVIPNLDTIEVPFNADLLGHTYFANTIPVLDDLAALIEDNCDPGSTRRAKLTRPNENSHWTFQF